MDLILFISIGCLPLKYRMISDYDPMILKLGALVNVREECDILYLLKMYELSIGIISDDAMVRSRGDPQVDGPILEMQNAAKMAPFGYLERRCLTLSFPLNQFSTGCLDQPCTRFFIGQMVRMMIRDFVTVHSWMGVVLQPG